MTRNHSGRGALALGITAILGTTLLVLGLRADDDQGNQDQQGAYVQQNLISSGFVQAKVTDANLVNPWGMVAGPTTPVWIDNQGTNTSTVYRVDSVQQGIGAILTVQIPTLAGGPNGPTGIVFNGTGGFPIPASAGGTVRAVFIFANLNGTISGWNPDSVGGLNNAVVAVTTSGAVYTGLALGMVGGALNLYAADFTPNGGIKVFNDSFQPATGLVTTAFVDDRLPGLPPDERWAPYNVANLNGKIYVAYAPIPATGGQPIRGKGNGVVAVFSTSGEFIRNLIIRGQLDDPWGMTMAPDQFGAFGGDLLVGNFGDGRIHAYDDEGGFAGTIRDADHKPLENGALWSLMFGNGVNGADPNTLYITTGGPDDSKDGLFAAITPAQQTEQDNQGDHN